ncbi:hypothetical protein [Streptomyces sp. NPDC058441]|uniref:hypothetical protein n=1 Tax=Streptomyces sp. NPDC058441 TaxID=3346502 RepID=UPI00365A9AA4
MTLTIPIVFLLGLALAALLRFRAVGWGAATIAVLFGLYLADTGARTTINDLTTAVVNAIPNDAN